MDKPTRNLIQKATQVARKLLEIEFSEQLSGIFDIRVDGSIAQAPGEHLDGRQRVVREKLVAAVEHEKAAGVSDADAVAAYLREASFTCLNRFAALKMLEARELVQECVSRGEQSSGFKEFCGLAPGLADLPDHGYRLYIESLFDELGTEIRVLFDRRDPASLLWPRQKVLEELLSILNRDEIADVWGEDETIGWVYQYFNSAEERKKMREESAAPRNSRELAVRNQFFTPRYVVEFLTDNTLGRIWYEMRQGKTALKEVCRYLVRRPNEVFLAAGEEVSSRQYAESSTQKAVGGRQYAEGSEQYAEDKEDLSQEDCLKEPVYIEHRAKKDPREIKVLDPACGSGHFLLYAFDVLVKIYIEAWEEQEEVCSMQYAEGSGEYAGGRGQYAEGADNEREELSGSDGVAKGGGFGRGNLRDDKGLSERGNLWPDEPAQTYRSLDSIQHSGGAGPDNEKGVSELPVNSARVGQGSGNPDSDRQASKLSVERENRSDPESGKRSRAVDQRALECALRQIGYDYSTSAYCPLPTAYSSKSAFLKEIPQLILRHNLHGIDIDPRAVQIAALSLWMRAQRAFAEFKIDRTSRPAIKKTNVVTAEPMPGEKDLLREFAQTLQPRFLGQLVEAVFDKMQLAGEAGSLLKIEEDIRDAIRAAKKQRKAAPQRQAKLFAQDELPEAKQMPLWDVSDISDERFWEEAEERIYRALEQYAGKANNGKAFRRRLFAEDTLRGFAFVDLCRKRYEVVLMNPPFGEFPRPYKGYSKTTYPNSYNDVLGAFVERGLNCLSGRGRLAAITSRACFFLTSFTRWREKVLIAQTALVAVADLGQGVMDNAMVEAAAYVLERSPHKTIIPFIRAIAQADREVTVRRGVSSINSGNVDECVFLARQDTFRRLTDSPLVYWATPIDLERLAALPTFEPEVAEVRVGLQTGDDPRFVRAVWEVPPKDTQFVYYPSNGETFCRLDDPIVLAYLARRRGCTPRWAFHVKSGASQPWFSPVTLKLNYFENGNELRNFRDAKGKSRAFLRSQSHYYRAGFSWTLRAARFYPYLIPGNCIPSVSRYMAFPEHGREYDILGVSASRIASAFMRFYGEKFMWPKFLVENLKILPWPQLTEDTREFFRKLIDREVEQRRQAYMNHEPFHEFLIPVRVRDFSKGGQALAFDPKTLLGETGEQAVAAAYGLSIEAAERLECDVTEALEFQHGPVESRDDSGTDTAEQDSVEDKELVLDLSDPAQLEALLSYCVGCIFGRWDVRMSLDWSLSPKLPAPFDPPPVCPPGMLIGPEGLPAKSCGIVSEQWLRARPDANTIPLLCSCNNPTIPDSSYPVRIPWDGIMVDDPGFEGGQLHDRDILLRTVGVLELLWKDKALDTEQEACQILNVPDLRTYFRKSFFPDHIKRYSKSRRKAPIYWQLATPSASYSLWLYYHRFTKDTFYKVLNEYVGPKLQFEEREFTNLSQQYGTHPTAGQRKELTARETFVAELRTFKEEVARIAPLWNPNLNDGVIINFAPLWRLVPQNKPWQRECKECWDKLTKGEYDWAHLAMHLWPERVVPKCTGDRSLAIAHGLEDALWEEDEAGKWTPKGVLRETLDALIRERTSPTVKAALQDLLNAPVPANIAGRNRNGRSRKT